MPVGSYFPATQVVKKPTKTNAGSIDGSCVLESGITDNFGNMLVEGNYYTPVVLSISAENEANAVQYSNSLSAFNSTPMFKYKA